MALEVGEIAPDFELPAVEGERQFTIKLSDFREKKHVVVSFHPLDWTPTCGAQVPAFDSDREKFNALGAQVVDISVDSIPSKIAWQKKEIGMMHVPMCADFYPHGKVCEQLEFCARSSRFPVFVSELCSSWIRAGRLYFPK